MREAVEPNPSTLSGSRPLGIASSIIKIDLFIEFTIDFIATKMFENVTRLTSRYPSIPCPIASVTARHRDSVSKLLPAGRSYFIKSRALRILRL